ncbi:ribosomal protein subunit L38 [Schizosaccharomyces octosporus yFS286]|uniref:Large ribosomal subunit protein uL14m n=1 Tax=Schizosaccharomyces octosporus (strain yFS286) TaxID=483514 RepID=S9Q188_SCHOY|nr:ribosomal protein subunit L38 [Schizosaccharomyces octosporus yFS286]EPX73478.1 ribosomal protein subunit L38 [Schizosaccharomyces octosporus yFS286]
MIGLKGILKVIDNSGATFAECIRVVRAGQFASVGDEVVVVVKKSRTGPNIATANKVKRGDIHHAVVVRTKFPLRRADGRYVRFDDNACVLVNKDREPIGTRILSVVANELRMKNHTKLASLAPRTV